MDAHQNKMPQDTEKLKEIPKWTRKYAQNRTLPTLVILVISMCLFAGIAIPSYFGGKALMTGHAILAGICFIVMAISMICVFIISIPKYGIKLTQRITRLVYGKEGSASIPAPESMKKTKWLGYLVALIFGSCVIGSVILGGKGFFPLKYMQPISALYVVPFTVFLYFWQRPIVSPIMLLWPILYTIHAILIVTGVPIAFTGNLIPLDMIVPVFGYGFLTYMIAHLYSRYALKKLKKAAHLQEDNNG
jgi:hypothetical protein